MIIEPALINTKPLASQEIEVQGADKDNYFVPDAQEKIQQMLAERAKNMHPRNRAERRALRKKLGRKARNEIDAITETATKLDYIDLIQKFRELNERKKSEVYKNEDFEEND